jgi:hypothetical protein
MMKYSAPEYSDLSLKELYYLPKTPLNVTKQLNVPYLYNQTTILTRIKHNLEYFYGLCTEK